METIEIQIKIEPDVQVFCDLFNITPLQLLQQYMHDLCSMQGNGGSDERYMAKNYFLRTYLASETEFTKRFADQLCEEFEGIYQNAYPSVCNATWKEDRAALLQEMHDEWKQNIKNFQSATCK